VATDAVRDPHRLQTFNVLSAKVVFNARRCHRQFYVISDTHDDFDRRFAYTTDI